MVIVGLQDMVQNGLWEDNEKKVNVNQDSPHPNRIGYKIMSDFIYDFLITKKTLI
jgi:hypothetical protein